MTYKNLPVGSIEGLLHWYPLPDVPPVANNEPFMPARLPVLSLIENAWICWGEAANKELVVYRNFPAGSIAVPVR